MSKTATKEIFTNHACIDRADRIAYIATTIGFGEVLYERYQPATDTYHTLSDTGVIIIRNANKVIVTMYIATLPQALAVAQVSHLPTYLARKIIKNNQKKKK